MWVRSVPLSSIFFFHFAFFSVSSIVALCVLCVFLSVQISLSCCQTIKHTNKTNKQKIKQTMQPWWILPVMVELLDEFMQNPICSISLQQVMQFSHACAPPARFPCASVCPQAQMHKTPKLIKQGLCFSSGTSSVLAASLPQLADWLL